MRRPVLFAAALLVLVCARGSAQEPTTGIAPEVMAKMQAWNKALGVECTHCHIDGQWDLGYLPVFYMAFKMEEMVEDLNTGALKDYGGVTCNTCHQGSITPPKVTEEQWQRDAKRYAAVFKGDESLALQMGVFTASLGSGCTLCHDPNNWASEEIPNKAVGRNMRGMVGRISRHFAGMTNPEIGCMTCHQGKLKPAR